MLAGQFALFDMLIYEVLGQFNAFLGPLGEVKIQLTLVERVFRIRKSDVPGDIPNVGPLVACKRLLTISKGSLTGMMSLAKEVRTESHRA